MDQSLFFSIERMLKPLRSKISNLIQKGIIHRIDKSNETIQMSFSDGDAQNNIKRCEHFGFTSHPPASSEALVLFPSGNRQTGLCISTQSKKGCPVELKEGESAHYNDEGSYIALKQDGRIEIKNRENELIQLIYALSEEIDNLSKISVSAKQGGNYPGGPCEIKFPNLKIADIQAKLNTFKV